MTEWGWRIGYLASLGPCAWQEHDGRIRRITHVMMGPQGQMGFGKAALSMLQKDADEIPNSGMVLHAIPASDSLCTDLDRLWGSNLIQPVNGNPRLRLT